MGQEASSTATAAVANQSPHSSISDGALRQKGIRRAHRDIRRKFNQGVTYNMKVIIRGDRGTGKSALLHRLEGGPFREIHEKTPEIRTAHINWSYKTGHENVMVEVWDVVDKGVPKPAASPLSSPGGARGPAAAAPAAIGGPNSRPSAVAAAGAPANSTGNGTDGPASPASSHGAMMMPALDAQLVDVYQGTHAVIFTIDPRRKETLEYVRRELENVPKTLDVLVLVLFRDMPNQEDRTIAEMDMENFMRRQPTRVRYIEASLLNGYGLRLFYNFLNLPFLKLKLAALKQKLVDTERDLVIAEKEIETVIEQDYESYLKYLNMHSGGSNTSNKKGAKAAGAVGKALGGSPIETKHNRKGIPGLDEDEPYVKPAIVRQAVNQGRAPAMMHAKRSTAQQRVRQERITEMKQRSAATVQARFVAAAAGKQKREIEGSMSSGGGGGGVRGFVSSMFSRKRGSAARAIAAQKQTTENTNTSVASQGTQSKTSSQQHVASPIIASEARPTSLAHVTAGNTDAVPGGGATLDMNAASAINAASAKLSSSTEAVGGDIYAFSAGSLNDDFFDDDDELEEQIPADSTPSPAAAAPVPASRDDDSDGSATHASIRNKHGHRRRRSSVAHSDASRSDRKEDVEPPTSRRQTMLADVEKSDDTSDEDELDFLGGDLAATPTPSSAQRVVQPKENRKGEDVDELSEEEHEDDEIEVPQPKLRVMPSPSSPRPSAVVLDASGNEKSVDEETIPAHVRDSGNTVENATADDVSVCTGPEKHDEDELDMDGRAAVNRTPSPSAPTDTALKTAGASPTQSIEREAPLASSKTLAEACEVEEAAEELSVTASPEPSPLSVASGVAAVPDRAVIGSHDGLPLPEDQNDTDVKDVLSEFMTEYSPRAVDESATSPSPSPSCDDGIVMASSPVVLAAVESSSKRPENVGWDGGDASQAPTVKVELVDMSMFSSPPRASRPEKKIDNVDGGGKLTDSSDDSEHRSGRSSRSKRSHREDREKKRRSDGSSRRDSTSERSNRRSERDRDRKSKRKRRDRDDESPSNRDKESSSSRRSRDKESSRRDRDKESSSSRRTRDKESSSSRRTRDKESSSSRRTRDKESSSSRRTRDKESSSSRRTRDKESSSSRSDRDKGRSSRRERDNNRAQKDDIKQSKSKQRGTEVTNTGLKITSGNGATAAARAGGGLGRDDAYNAAKKLRESWSKEDMGSLSDDLGSGDELDMPVIPSNFY